MEKNTYPVPFKMIGDKMILLLSALGDTGNLRAATINKSRKIKDYDKHHCLEVNVKGSVRYIPKKFYITD
jgi:hypothetical protein